MYKQAARVDQGFALAWARLAGEQSTQRQFSESFASYRKALAALDAHRVTKREDLRIRGFYAVQTR